MIEILSRGLPVIGYVKIGQASEKASKLKGAPMKFDHLEVTGRQRDPEGRLFLDPFATADLIAKGAATCGGCERARELAKIYDEPLFEKGLPTQLPILLPYDELELNLPNRLAYYKGRTAYCTGDGIQAQRIPLDEKGGPAGPAAPFGPCGSACPDFQARRCKPHAKLRFVLGTQENVGGCYEFVTTSWNSLRNLVESLRLIQTMTRGKLAWVPLRFEIGPQTVQPRSGGPTNTAWIARVTFPGTPRELLASVREHLAVEAPMHAEIRRLEAVARGESQWTETPEEIELHRQEFVTGDEEEGAEPDPAPDPQPGPAAPPAEPELPLAADPVDQPDPHQSTATGPATEAQKAELGRAAANRAEALFEGAAIAEQKCLYASPQELTLALKSRALVVFNLKGVKQLPAAAVAPMIEYWQRCELDPEGKLVDGSDGTAF